MKVPTELLPCPFCCGEGLIFQLKVAPKMWRVECKNCDAGPSASLSATHAVEKWNRRAPSSELLELREAVKPFAALYTESMRDFPDGTANGERPDDRHAWGFNNANLLWGDFRRAARSLQSHNTGEA